MNYVDPQHELATTVVKDKYGIIPLVNDLLLALHYAEMSSTIFDDDQALKNEMSNNIAVVDALVQLEASMVSLSQELGGTLVHNFDVVNANNVPTTDAKDTNKSNALKDIEQLNLYFDDLLSNSDDQSTEQLRENLDTFSDHVNVFATEHGEHYNEELSALQDVMIALEDILVGRTQLGVVKTGNSIRTATKADYIELIETTLHNF